MNYEELKIKVGEEIQRRIRTRTFVVSSEGERTGVWSEEYYRHLWLNIRVFIWHLQIGAPKWYVIRIKRNGWHGQQGWPDGDFSIYKFPWRKE